MVMEGEICRPVWPTGPPRTRPATSPSVVEEEISVGGVIDADDVPLYRA
jgi:hypothetical protein